MPAELNYRIEPMGIEVSDVPVRPKRFPVNGAGKPLHLHWAGQHVWFTGSANCIGRRTQGSGEIKLFPRDRGVCPTRIVDWFNPGSPRMLYVDPEGGFVGTIGFDGAMTERAFPGARPQALAMDMGDVWIGCAGAPHVLRARGDDIHPQAVQPPRPVDALSKGPDGDLWYFSGDVARNIRIENGLGHELKLPTRFNVHDMHHDAASGNAYYCDEQRDVIGQITDWESIVEYQLPKGTGPRRVRSTSGERFWFTGRGGRSLFHVDGYVAVEHVSAHANSDLFDFDFGADEVWCTEPNANCLSSISIKGL